MNYFSLALLFFSGFTCIAQTFQKKRDPIYRTDFETVLVAASSTITVSRYKSPSELEYTLQVQTQNSSCGSQSGLRLVLLNGEQITLPDNPVRCDALRSHPFQLSSSCVLTPQLLQKLTQQDIAYFVIGDVTVPVQYKEEGENIPQLLMTVISD